MPNRAPSDEFVQSLARGLAVIETFGAERPDLTLSEVAEAVGLSRAAARRFLLTLVELGFARQTDSRFSLTPRVLRLGTAYLSGLGLPDVAQPHLERLSATVGESTVGITVGTRFPAFATSMGRVLLAGLGPEQLDEFFESADLTPPTDRTVADETQLRPLLAAVRQQGYAYNDQELAPGLRSIAAPVCDRTGRVVAAINISSTVAHDPVREFVGALRQTAADIGADVAEIG
jgi:IclR family pca regulon transcriptional regulator